MLATSTAFFRDTRHLLEVLLAVLFWTTPIVYDVHQLPTSLRLAILFSPMSPFLTAYHQVLFLRQSPDAIVWIMACGYAMAAFIAGTAVSVVFDRRIMERM